ncbi:heavy metal-associated isoprenylated plant protein 3-like [Lycium ferocissimum]|uniref:heavy metal-associated isoprenylated plant protein 3-like n=1 Tax=Lycium ferocissimum TaxID=112874 RepID=UPI00281649F8|nr:heavy metal-associated isoprenylated plant protein 3-like [Lycium ferocissimum]
MSSKKQENKKEDENVKVVLMIDMHCVCKNCFKRIAKCTQNMEGVKSMNIEDSGTKYKVTMTGKLDPMKLQQKFEKKLEKKVELISPKPKEKKEKEIPKKTTLEMNLGCDKCVKKMQKIVTETKGFEGIFIDKPKNLVIVSGVIDTEYLVENLKKELKKSVKIIKQEKYEDDVKIIWCPNYYYYYGPECDRFVREEAEYCRIM